VILIPASGLSKPTLGAALSRQAFCASTAPRLTARRQVRDYANLPETDERDSTSEQVCSWRRPKSRSDELAVENAANRQLAKGGKVRCIFDPRRRCHQSDSLHSRPALLQPIHLGHPNLGGRLSSEISDAGCRHIFLAKTWGTTAFPSRLAPPPAGQIGVKRRTSGGRV
jgi:hypothetical protein